MAKNYSNKSRKRKALIAMLCALSVTCTGLAAACAPDETPEPPSTEVTAKEDNQLLKNGNFEHFDIPDKAVHLIKNVNSWTLGGDTSVKSGIIGTSKPEWDKLTADDLAEKLDFNNDLSTSNEDYVNYNSMRSRDLLYKDNSAALLADDDVKDVYWLNEQGYENYFGITGNDTDGYKLGDKDVYKSDDNGEFYFDENKTQLVRKEMIANPGTHLGDFKEEDGKYYYGATEVYADDDGFYYTDKDLKNPVGNVLMVHNSPTDTKNNNGLHQYYTSSSVTLEKQTSAEISLWVKTSDLKFNKGYAANADEQDLGAYIEVIQTVSGSNVDSFRIKAINTAKILQGASDATLKENNGWIQYTVYVNACDFADSTIQLRLGLGSTENNEKVTGYAFFDDVRVTKYRDLEADGTDCTYKDHKTEIDAKGTACNLTDEGDDKIFYADKAGANDRHAYDFHYLIDLASETGVEGVYQSFTFGQNVEAGLTEESDSHGVKYAAATSTNAVQNSISKKTQNGLKLPKDVEARPTQNDIIGAYPLGYEFKKDTDFSGQGVTDYSKVLNDGLKGADKLPATNANSNMLVTFSAWGAPYTSTVDGGNTFSLAKGGYLLVSFWVKTSDMEGSTAATVKIYEYKDAANKIIDESSVKSLTIDTTGNTTDFEGEEDIYSGWVQCFLFVKNETGKTNDPAKNFYIDFSFGTSAITTTTSYEGGWAALANMRTLEINKEIYDLATAGTNTALFEFSKAADEDGGTAFADATGTSDIKEGIAVPDSYNGRNGANASGNVTNGYAGLINREEFENYLSKTDILDAFYNSAIDSEKSWNGVFGADCYQPLIIINNLRAYAEKATANENNFKNYWIKKDGNYVKVAEDATYDENETYYSLAANYGYVGNSKTVSANGREVISVRVKVTGDATAYVYLVDNGTDELLNYTTPAYTFWYDKEGNVLDEEYDEDWTRAKHAEHVVYTLRKDGLYEDKDGKIFANLHNLVKSYKDSKYEHNDFFTKDGDNYTAVSFDDLKDGETYYSDKNGTIANHYLCNSDGANVYEYIDGKYYYLENHKTTTEVTNFALTYARYENPDIDEKLYVAVTAEDCKNFGKDGWVTVNFVIQAGSDSKSYRLELWSGDRNETGVKADGTLEKSGAVAFDYFHGTVSDTRLAAYEKEIIEAYNNAITEVNDEINAGITDDDEKVNLFAGLTSGTKENIRTYEELVAGLTQEQQDAVKAKLATYTYSGYVASYYTFTLYDSSSYIPFNANTAADGETGYDYDPSSYTEQLAYLEFNDKARGEMNVFVDYSAVEQDIPMNTVDDGDDGDDEEENNNTAELGLYISSIVLVVVLLITLASILITQHVKKKRKIKGAKNSEKNVYRKRDRYVKKLHLVKDELVDPEKDGTTGNEAEPAEDAAEDVTDTPAGAPAEETAEPTEPTEAAEPAEENPDGDNKE